MKFYQGEHAIWGLSAPIPESTRTNLFTMISFALVLKAKYGFHR